MKRSLLLALLSGVAVGSIHAQFVAGDLVVDRIGDGTQTLANTGNSVFLDQYTTAGAAVNTVAIPSTGATALIQSGTAGSEGALSLSQDGSQLIVAGYNVAIGSSATSISAATSATVPRGVGSVNAAGTYTFVTPTTAFSANNIRTATLGSGGNYYAGGGNSGTVIVNGGGAGTAAQTQTANTRVNNVFNGILYFSTGSATGNAGAGIYSVGRTPVGAGSTPTLTLATGTGASPYDFALNPNGTILYVADDRASAAGGIQRYDLTNGAFTLTYTLGTGVANIGARGLAVNFSGTNPVVYATTAEATNDRLITITDTGAASAATTLATSGTNELFRGLDFAPGAAVPEPSTWAMCLAGLGGLAHIFRRRARRA